MSRFPILGFPREYIRNGGGITEAWDGVPFITSEYLEYGELVNQWLEETRAQRWLAEIRKGSGANER